MSDEPEEYNDFTERAAIVEEGEKVPRHVAEELARQMEQQRKAQEETAMSEQAQIALLERKVDRLGAVVVTLARWIAQSAVGVLTAQDVAMIYDSVERAVKDGE